MPRLHCCKTNLSCAISKWDLWGASSIPTETRPRTAHRLNDWPAKDRICSVVPVRDQTSAACMCLVSGRTV